MIIVKDAGGTSGSGYPLIIVRDGTDEFENGSTSVTINTNFSYEKIISDGVSKWLFVT